MMEAYRDGVPGNDKRFPEGSKIVKIEWTSKRNPESPYFVMVPDTLKTVSFIEKDTKRFPQTHGWAYAQFRYEAGTDSFDLWVPRGRGGKGLHIHGVPEKMNPVHTRDRAPHSQRSLPLRYDARLDRRSLESAERSRCEVKRTTVPHSRGERRVHVVLVLVRIAAKSRSSGAPAKPVTELSGAIGPSSAPAASHAAPPTEWSRARRKVLPHDVSPIMRRCNDCAIARG
jgi:hypothetical protein